MGFPVYTEYIIERDGAWRFTRVLDRWRHTQACCSTWICYQTRSLRPYRWFLVKFDKLFSDHFTAESFVKPIIFFIITPGLEITMFICKNPKCYMNIVILRSGVIIQNITFLYIRSIYSNMIGRGGSLAWGIDGGIFRPVVALGFAIKLEV